MDIEKLRLREEVENAHAEIERYKEIIEKYKIKIDKVLIEYEVMKKETARPTRTTKTSDITVVVIRPETSSWLSVAADIIRPLKFVSLND